MWSLPFLNHFSHGKSDNMPQVHYSIDLVIITFYAMRYDLSGGTFNFAIFNEFPPHIKHYLKRERGIEIWRENNNWFAAARIYLSIQKENLGLYSFWWKKSVYHRNFWWNQTFSWIPLIVCLLKALCIASLYPSISFAHCSMKQCSCIII